MSADENKNTVESVSDEEAALSIVTEAVKNIRGFVLAHPECEALVLQGIKYGRAIERKERKGEKP